MAKFFGFEIKRSKVDIPDTKSKGMVPPTSVRKSKPTLEETYLTTRDNLTFVDVGFLRTVIPVIRKLTWINADMGLALNDMVRLTNTGHRIKFDQNIPPEKRDAMRRHLLEVRKNWGDGIHGINGLINKWIAQIWVSGALCNEWIINTKKTGIYNNAIVNPETIYFVLDKTKNRFIPYQKQNFKTGGLVNEKMVKMSPYVFKYHSINGDTEIPYGIPPFLTALSNINIQGSMDKNIDFIMAQLGLLGFFETLIEKPGQTDGESDTKYKARLSTLLDETKLSIKDGLKDGTVVGFDGDHSFNFHSPTKNLSGASDLYKQNEIKIANGLKVAPEFLGFPTGSSESAMGIIFTKMLSQLVNVQELIKVNLEFGYILELVLAGYGNVHLEVEFKPSTISDELKFQQAQEIKIRNIDAKYNSGVIGQQQKAEELGYDKPDQEEPRAPIDDTAKKKQKREADKDTSDRKSRDKAKPVPKRKDTNTKPS